MGNAKSRLLYAKLQLLKPYPFAEFKSLCLNRNTMDAPGEKIIWTIGHSTRTLEELVSMLKSFEVELLCDIRNYPGSRRYPHFNKDALEISLPLQQIEYIHLEDLGGRRKANIDSKNTGWRHAAFRGYADYMETNFFKKTVAELEAVAGKKQTVIMCSEAVSWSCHRALVADHLKFHGWKVMHIMNVGKQEEHPYTAPARIINGQLSYRREELNF